MNSYLQHQNLNMKTRNNTIVKILITLIVIAFIVMVGAIIYRAEGAEKTGYLIGIQTGNKVSIHKVLQASAADSIVYNHFGYVFTGFSTLQATKYYPHVFKFETHNKQLYCEKKRVVRCKNGKLKFVRIRKNDR